MSFSWSASASPSFAGVKSVSTNSFADALRRLAEHVEEKNKHSASQSAAPNLVQSSLDFSTRMGSPHVNNSMTPEQALRLYTQYIQELERREEMRRTHLQTFPPSDSSSVGSSMLSRRFDGPDPFRFMGSHTTGPFHPSAYFQPLAQQPRLPLASSCSLPNSKSADVASRIPTQENTNDKSMSSRRSSKPKSKLFRPYDLDSPRSDSQRPSPAPAELPSDSHSTPSSGKEKQLFNSLGLVQQLPDVLPERSSFTETSPSVSTSDESSSIETLSTPQDHPLDRSPFTSKDSSSSAVLKRKSTFSSDTKQSSHRKQSKTDSEHSHH